MKKSVLVISSLAAAAVIAIGAVTAVALTAGGRTAKREIALGDRYLSEMDYENAVLAYTRAIEADPRNAEAYYGLGMANLAMDGGGGGGNNNNNSGDNGEAALLQALNLKPDYTDAYLSLADYYLANDRLEDAAELLEKAVTNTDNEEIKELGEQTKPNPPEFSLKSGSYSTYQLVEINPPTQGDSVYYTLDGSLPTREEGIPYTQPLILPSGETHLKAVTVSTLGFSSEAALADYTVTATPKELTFTDPEMERYIRSVLRISGTTPLTDEAVAQIQQIIITGTAYPDASTVTFTREGYQTNRGSGSGLGQIATLSDLQYMPFLTEVAIAYQEDLNLTGLSGHDRLTAVSLIHDGISSIAPLQNLPALTTLCLAENHISDLSGLSALTGLTSLGLWGNQLTSLGPVSSFQSLTYLDVSDNQISDISSLSGLPLLKELWMYGNRISDFSPVTKLPSIRVLMLRDNPGTDLSPVETVFPRLTRLDVNVRSKEASAQ